MAFDLKKLSEDVDLTEVLTKSVEATAPVVAVWNGETAIPINPPPAVDYAAELAEAIAQCQSAAARAAGLLARLRGGGQ